MTTLKITEGDQTIIREELEGFVPPNQFIADLVNAARASGQASALDDDGCEVTAQIITV